jgi:hypothetical protein
MIRMGRLGQAWARAGVESAPKAAAVPAPMVSRRLICRAEMRQFMGSVMSFLCVACAGQRFSMFQ